MLQALITCAALASVTLTAPSNPPSYNKNSQTDKFDNIAGVEGVAVSPVTENSIYNNKKYNGFSLAETLAPFTNIFPGVIPQSAPNFIAFGAGDLQTISQGKSIEPRRQPAITLDFNDSESVYYDLYSFFFACALGTQENVTGKPVDCTLTLTGYGPPPTNTKKATASFKFSTDGALVVDMQEAVLPASFRGLYRTTFEVKSAAGALVAGLVDNVENAVYTK